MFCSFDQDCPEDHRCVIGFCQRRPWWQPFFCGPGTCVRGDICYQDKCVPKMNLFLRQTGRYLCDTEGTPCEQYSHKDHVCDKGLCTTRGNVNLMKCGQGAGSCGSSGDCRSVFDQDLCVPSNLEKGAACELDDQCPVGQACYQSHCTNQNYLYYNKLCSYDGHCLKHSCINGSCSGYYLHSCSSTIHCPDYHYCSSNGKCHRPQRDMFEGEAIPCLSDAECPNERVCFHNGCVRWFSVTRTTHEEDTIARCHKSTDCGDGKVCFDDFCVISSMIPTVTSDGKLVEAILNTQLKSLNISKRTEGRSCANDISCRTRQLCIEHRCRQQPRLTACNHDKECPEAALCHRGRCLYILE